MSEQEEPKIVWVSCRANGRGCGGNRAVIVSERVIHPTPNVSISGKSSVGGPFNSSAGGKHIRYRCLDCNGVFIITT